ncbi:DUF2513 domain-containing protein [Lapidilactobacillus bayanensis]|uniref:DUF2513 domain-containing protein n=1 Tax=Lapidilactobacillus bayanensis TaxID=2485998 RepID=UPI000F79CF5C|nr:DUF2513 domain-containing protein [Lapidilactobacillus bayanensis]
MKLDPDCIRDVLLTVEKHATFSQEVKPQAFADDGLLEKYDMETLLYHIRETSNSGLISGLTFYMSRSFVIKDLTPEGHEFLANIRSEENWKKTKSIAAKTGSFSLEVLKATASGVTIAFLNKLLGQQ